MSCLAFNFSTLVFLIPTELYDTLLDENIFFIHNNLLFFILGSLGMAAGSVLTKYSQIQRRYIISYFFNICFVFSFVTFFYRNLASSCGGIILFSVFLNLSVIYHFSHEIFMDYIVDKLVKLLTICFFACAFISVTVSILLYSISYQACVIGLIAVSISGVFFPLFIDKDIPRK